MEALLEQLTGVNGVTGAALFNSSGACVAHKLSPPYEPILLVEAVQELRSATEMFTYLDDAPFQGFVARLDSGVVVSRQSGDWMVLVLGSPALKTAMLNVALSVVTLKLKQVGSPAAMAGAASGSRPSVSMSLGSMGSSGSGAEAPPDAVGTTVMRALLKELSKQLGPFAKVILKQELGRMGLSARTVGRRHYDDLVKVLAKKIPEGEKKEQFIASVRDLPGS